MSDPRNYTVGWICAVSTEYVAARAFLDEVHEEPDYVSEHDNNDYTLGRIRKHNVIIAVLPDGEYGTDSAESVARDMLHSFPNIRIGLMVGIGGGAPSRYHDIRLGDIVVSSPRDGKGGVFEYDFGKTIQDLSFQHTRFLNQPPTVLRTAVSGLKAQYKESGHQIEEAINSILEKKPRLRQEYKRPDPSSDRLYQAGFTHPPNNEASCTAICGDDPSKLIIRRERTEMEDNPAIHYGLIASGNQLMKDALTRDTLAKEKDVLCFEMEAAGLMNRFPCLVIRGICDYSDSHKNKGWQGYAAMAAAGYAKDLLCRIAPNRVEAGRKISDILSSVQKDVQDARNAVKDLGFEQRREKIDCWLSPADPSTNYNKALQQRQEGTGLWFLQSNAFAKWKTQRNSFLWLYGIPGCGKTILSSTIVEDLKRTLPRQPLLYFYFDFNDTGKQILESMVRSLISQLYCKGEDTWKQLDSLFSSCEAGRRQPSCESFCKVFLYMIGYSKEVWIVLDALDECRTRRGPPTKGLLSWMRDLLSSEGRNVHLLVTSRPEQDIESELGKWPYDNDIVPIEGDSVTDDIRAYVHTRVRNSEGLKRWQSRPNVQQEIETKLMEKANDMFRWAACQLDALENCLEYRTLQTALSSLPKTLDETYDRILRGIPDEHKPYAIRILQFLTFSERPLRIKEAVDAIAVDTEGDQHFNPDYRMPVPREISYYCSSLVVAISTKEHSYDKDGKHAELRLAHFSVREYLTSTRLGEDMAQNFQGTTARASIAIVCLAYLLHFDRDIPPEEIRESFPLAQYSARYWMTHAAVAEVFIAQIGHGTIGHGTMHPIRVEIGQLQRCITRRLEVC
ncbi:purine and uridine phosphorylase [Zopfia rhizophila CBS 207.26]|uniref:Purine and uridine phosphorylase n=1 Tax=Zopfia rhizophila CBS 207.26 TaxID=1314779 RepID=A0A6A6E2Q7_9PEZI|nr:purine and uridine phosphorylase [Zopfia rhizophila CBS 207.26]